MRHNKISRKRGLKISATNDLASNRTVAISPTRQLDATHLEAVAHGRKIRLSPHAALEWIPHDSKSSAPPPWAVSAPSAGENVVEIHTPNAAGDVHIALRLPAAADVALMACRMVLKIEHPKGTKQGIFPTLSQRDLESDALKDVPSSSANIILDNNRWYEVTGLFATAATNDRYSIDPVLRLPTGSKVSIATIDTQRFDLISAPDLAVAQLAQTVQTVMPFSAQPIAEHQIREKLQHGFCFFHTLSLVENKIYGWVLSEPACERYEVIIGDTCNQTSPLSPVELAKNVVVACGIEHDAKNEIEFSAASHLALACAEIPDTPLLQLPIPLAQRRLQFSAHLTPSLSIQGRFHDAEKPDQAFQIALYDDSGNRLAQTTTQSSINSHYNIPLPPTLLDGICRTLRLQIVDYPAVAPIELTFGASQAGIGMVETLAENRLSGWALSPSQTGKKVDILVQSGRETLGQGSADIFRSDLTHILQSNGFHGFAIQLTRALQPQDLHDLQIYISGTDTPIGFAPLLEPPELVPSDTVVPDITEELPAHLRYAGRLDTITLDGVNGWALDKSDRNKSIIVDLFINGVQIESKRADGWRGDIQRQFGGHGRCGFHISFPPGMDLTPNHVISIRFANTGLNLSASPREWKAPRVGKAHDTDTPCDPFPLLPADLAPPQTTAPQVAIIVLNLNGASHLENLFCSFAAHNTYPNYRFIVVDHGSTDTSFDICQTWSDRVNIDLQRRGMNFSFSASNNYGVEVSEGDILFFLNNDILVDHCILSPLVRCFDDATVGIVGLKLASPIETDNAILEPGFVQHLGVKFGLRPDRPLISPYELPHVESVAAVANKPWDVPAVTGAALAMRRSDFETVGGFDERYFYGYEDIDFCLASAHKLKKRVVCANHIQAYHNRGSTRTQQDQAARHRYAQNQELLSQRFGALVRQQTRKDMVSGGRFWRLHALRIAFAVSTTDFAAPEADYFTAFELGDALSKNLGWHVTYLPPNQWYDLADFDVVVAMRQDWSPRKIKSSNPNLMCIAWPRNWFERWLELPWLKRFDLIWSASQKACSAFENRVSVPVVLMRIATNTTRFHLPETNDEVSQSDYCFTGSFFRSPRDILSQLDPAQLPYDFALYGHNWQEIAWLEPYWRGALPYDQLPAVYANTKIVIDDANFTVKNWGSVNSRVYDALAAGVLVLTNGKLGAQEVFDGKLPTYDSPKELHDLLHYFLGNPDARIALGKTLQQNVLTHHSYTVRAQTAAHSITTLFNDLRLRIDALPSETGTETPSDFINTLQDRLRQNMSWVRQYSPNEQHPEIEKVGEDIVLHVSTQPCSRLPEMRADQLYVRLHLGSSDDISLSEARSYDALVVSNRTDAEMLSPAELPIITLFDSIEDQAACYEITQETGALRYQDARAMRQALDKAIPTLVAQIRELNQNKYDHQIQRGEGKQPQQQVARTTHLLYWPDYRLTNPYQRMMYASLPDGVLAQPGSIDHAIRLQQDSLDPVMFHLQWTSPILGLEQGRVLAENRLTAFLEKLDRFQALGGKLIWTIHNLLSHEVPFPDLEAQLCQEISNRAQLVHVHGAKVVELVAPHYQIAPEKLRIAAHGSYIGVYPDDISRDAARKAFDIPPETKLFLFFGQVRAYKGLEELLDAFKVLRAQNKTVALIIAGNPVNQDITELQRQAQEIDGVQLHLRDIPDEEIQTYMRAADVMVLPYRNILTSGSAYLAQSYGLPIVAPAIGLLPDILRDGENAITYAPESTTGLQDALHRASRAPLDDLATAAFETAQTCTWHDIQCFIGRDALATLEGKPQNVLVHEQTRSCIIRAPRQAAAGRVAAAVLHYSHVDDTIRCVNALLKQTYNGLHIYIVSNDEDATAFDLLSRQFPECTVIQSPENLGYAGGNNIALSLAQTQGHDLLWLVNPDTIAPPEYLSKMVEVADLNLDVSVFGSKILYGHRPETVWFAGGFVSWENGLESTHGHIGKPSKQVPDRPIPSDYITGASLFLRTSILENVGYIPEEYFLYFEETHWCLKAASLGHKIVTFPQTALHHHKRSEAGGAPTPTFLYYYVRNAFLMCAHFQPEKIEQTEARLKKITRIWLETVANNIPERLLASQQAVARGFEDGAKGLSGKVPVSHYTE